MKGEEIMRDVNRIPDFLKTVEEVWRKYPDMRFGQVVVNVLGVDPFYVEDEESKQMFKKFGEQMSDVNTEDWDIN